MIDHCPGCGSYHRSTRGVVNSGMEEGRLELCVHKWHWSTESAYDVLVLSPADIMWFRRMHEAFYVPMEEIREKFKEEKEEIERLRISGKGRPSTVESIARVRHGGLPSVRGNRAKNPRDAESKS